MRHQSVRLFIILALALAVRVVAGATPASGSGAPLHANGVAAGGPAPAPSGRARTTTPSPTTEPQMDGYMTRIYVDPLGATMTYYLHIPSGYSPHQRYPLVLLLHGSGEVATAGAPPEQNAAVLLGDPYVRVWSGAPIQARWPSFIVVPQLVAPARWVNVPGGQGSYTLQSQPPPALQMAMAIVATVRAQYAIDRHRIYLTGLSMGGYGAWEAAERWPSTFAAVVPISGAGDPAKAAALMRVPVWAFQSADDGVVPISASRDMIAAIQAVGGHPCFTELPGGSHDTSTWMSVYTDNALLTWLFAQGTPAAMASRMPRCSA